MSKIVKNNTASPLIISDVGITIAASSQYTIPAQDYLLWAASDDIIVSIGSGDATVNDGSVDLSNSDGVKLLQGIFPSSVGVIGGSDDTRIGNEGDKLKVVLSPIDPGNFNTFKSNTEVNLTSNTTYNNLHTVNGSGVLVGATFVVDNDEVDCRILIDNNVIFDFNGQFLSEVVNKDGIFTASGIFGSTKDGKRLYFTPSTPIAYNTSLVFQARKSGKKVKYQLYTYSAV
jgi:hypothetical protein